MDDTYKIDMLQVCVVVKDLDEAMKRYSSAFGVGPFLVYNVDTSEWPGIKEGGKPADFRIRLAMSKLGNAILELLESQRGMTIWQDFLDKHGEGVHHLGLFVDDFEAAFRHFTQQGFTVTVEGPIVGEMRSGRFAYLDTHNNLGTTVELLDMPEDLMAKLM
jgi:4-hydroxyphenylpyruvate dioxygenase-like putative hemolysin